MNLRTFYYSNWCVCQLHLKHEAHKKTVCSRGYWHDGEAAPVSLDFASSDSNNQEQGSHVTRQGCFKPLIEHADAGNSTTIDGRIRSYAPDVVFHLTATRKHRRRVHEYSFDQGSSKRSQLNLCLIWSRAGMPRDCTYCYLEKLV